MSDPLPPTDEARLIGRYEKVLDRVQEAIRSADTKASTIIAATTAMIAATLLSLPQPELRTGTSIALAACGALPAIITMAACLRITGPQHHAKLTSLLFWREIAKVPVSDFASRAAAVTEEEYAQDLLQQVHRNSEIADNKHCTLAKTMKALPIVVAAWLAFTILVLEQGVGVAKDGCERKKDIVPVVADVN